MGENQPGEAGTVASRRIHASALLVGAMAVLIRGASGAGKSALVLDLLAALAAEGRFGRLIGDDQVAVEASHGRLIVRGVAEIAGLIERRGLGIARVPFEAAGLVGLVVDLIPGEPRRLPEAIDQRTDLCGILVRRIAISDSDALKVRSVMAAIDADLAAPDQMPAPTPESGNPLST